MTLNLKNDTLVKLPHPWGIYISRFNQKLAEQSVDEYLQKRSEVMKQKKRLVKFIGGVVGALALTVGLAVVAAPANAAPMSESLVAADTVSAQNVVANTDVGAANVVGSVTVSSTFQKVASSIGDGVFTKMLPAACRWVNQYKYWDFTCWVAGSNPPARCYERRYVC